MCVCARRHSISVFFSLIRGPMAIFPALLLYSDINLFIQAFQTCHTVWDKVRLVPQQHKDAMRRRFIKVVQAVFCKSAFLFWYLVDRIVVSLFFSSFMGTKCFLQINCGSGVLGFCCLSLQTHHSPSVIIVMANFADLPQVIQLTWIY